MEDEELVPFRSMVPMTGNMTGLGLPQVGFSKHPLTALAETKPELASDLIDTIHRRDVALKRDLAETALLANNARCTASMGCEWLRNRHTDESGIDIEHEESTSEGGWFGSSRSSSSKLSIRIHYRK